MGAMSLKLVECPDTEGDRVLTQDFGQRRPDSRAGGDLMWADGVDTVFFPGRGHAEFGDQECKWIVWDASEVLRQDDVFSRCGPAFNGLHYMLGFHTACGASSVRSRIFAERLNAGYRVRDAWIQACTETESSNASWAYMRAEAPGADTFDDHWWGKGYTSADPVNPTVKRYVRGSC